MYYFVILLPCPFFCPSILSASCCLLSVLSALLSTLLCFCFLFSVYVLLYSVLFCISVLAFGYLDTLHSFSSTHHYHFHKVIITTEYIILYKAQNPHNTPRSIAIYTPVLCTVRPTPDTPILHTLYPYARKHTDYCMSYTYCMHSIHSASPPHFSLDSISISI